MLSGEEEDECGNILKYNLITINADLDNREGDKFCDQGR